VQAPGGQFDPDSSEARRADIRRPTGFPLHGTRSVRKALARQESSLTGWCSLRSRYSDFLGADQLGIEIPSFDELIE